MISSLLVLTCVNICDCFTTESETDISLKDRQIEYNENNMSVCEENCEFSEYNYDLAKAVCSCLTKTKIEKISDIKINKKGLYSNFKNIVNIANLELIKCAYLLFNKNGFINNSANYIMLILFIFSIITLILFITREYKKINEFIIKITEIKISKENGFKNTKKKIIKVIKKKKKKKRKIISGSINTFRSENFNIINEINKGKEKKELIVITRVNTIQINNNNIQDTSNKNENYLENKILTYNDSELNVLSYEDAIQYDKRTYWQYYFSLIRTQHILFFSFYKGNDYNIRIIKIYLFFFTFAINYSVSILFYNYETMHKIYEEKGTFNFIYQIPQILYSAIITAILSSLVNKLGLCEDNIITIKNAKKENLEKEKESGIKTIYIKFILFFIVTYILLFAFWVYSISFCVVYKNTQIHLLKDVIISFSTSFIQPFIIYLLPGIFRISSLRKEKDKKICLYKFSKYLQIL